MKEFGITESPLRVKSVLPLDFPPETQGGLQENLLEIMQVLIELFQSHHPYPTSLVNPSLENFEFVVVLRLQLTTISTNLYRLQVFLALQLVLEVVV
jgi:hypothetical protein